MRIYENVKIEENPHNMHGRLSNILNKKHIYNGDDSNNYDVEPVGFTWRLAITNDEEKNKKQKNISSEFDGHYCGGNIFAEKTFIDHCYDETKINKEIKEDFIKTFKKLSFTKELCEKVNEYEIKYENTLGISVRTWQAEHEGNSYRPYNYETYEKAIRKELLNEKIDTIFFSYDNEKFKEEYIKLFSEYPKVKILMRDKKEEEDKVLYVMLNCILLSKCGTLIFNRISTFSEIAYWLGECKQKVIPLF